MKIKFFDPPQIVAGLLVLATCFVLLPANAQAQRPDRKVVGDLFKSWLESELEKADQKRRDAERASSLRDEKRTQLDLPKSPRRPNVALRPSAAPAMNSYRTNLRSYSENIERLSNQLQSSARGNQNLRPLIAETYKVQVRANLLYKQSETINDPAVIAERYCDLDCQWRSLSHSMKNANLDRTCQSYVAKLDQQCNKMCAVLDLDPQFDRERMLKLMVRASSYIRTLLDDIEIELYGQPECDKLLSDGRQLQEAIKRESVFVRDGSYDQVLSRFGKFSENWRAYSRRLYRYEEPHIQRRLGRIRSVGTSISELLWQNPTVDYAYAEHVVVLTRRELKLLFDQMTVSELVSLPPQQRSLVLSAASNLSRDCDAYSKLVTQQQSLESLRQQYLVFNQEWGKVNPILSSIKTDRVTQCSHRLELHVQDMNRMLRIQQSVDQTQLVSLGASLEEIAHTMQLKFGRMDKAFSTPQFKQRAISTVNEFRDVSRTLHLDIARGRDLNRLRGCCNDVIRSWNQLEVVITSMPKNGIGEKRFASVNQSRQDAIGIVAEIAAYLAE